MITGFGSIGCETSGWFAAGGGPGTSPPVSGAPADEKSTAADADAEPAGFLRNDQVTVLRIRFDILRARVARGGFSESGKIWNHVDEEAIPADVALLLQRNGLRVGRGNVEAWPPIKALLEAEDPVETSQSSMIVSNGLPFTVNLDPRPRSQVLFMLRPGGYGAGTTYEDSTNFLRIEYLIPESDVDAVRVDVMPEIRLAPTAPRVAFSPDGLIEQPSQRPTRVLRELAFRMLVGPEEFFAIGPSPAAHQGHLAGSLLLCEEIDGRPLESMYFITPRVVSTVQTGMP